MGTIIAFFTGVYSKVVALGAKLFASGSVWVTGLLARLGIKLLSYGWIEKTFNAVKKALSVIKKVAFNKRVVSIIKCLLSVALCVVSLIQIFFVGRTIYENASEIISQIKIFDISLIIFMVAIVVGMVATFAQCVLFILGLIKKRIKLSFVPTIMITYLLLCFLGTCLSYANGVAILQSFTLIDVLAILLLAYAFIKLFDKTYPVSVFGIIFATVGIILAFVVFKNANFATLVNFEIVGEISFTGKDIGIVSAIKSFTDPAGMVGYMRLVYVAGLGYSTYFASSLYIGVSTFAIVVSQLLPYVFLSCAIGLMMSLVNERQKQYAYITKVIKTLGYMMLAVVVTFILMLVVTLFLKKPEGVYLVISQSTSALILTVAMIVVMMIVSAIARTLFVRKLYGKLKVKNTK